MKIERNFEIGKEKKERSKRIVIKERKIRFISTKRLSQAQTGRTHNLVSVQNHKIAINKKSNDKNS